MTDPGPAIRPSAPALRIKGTRTMAHPSALTMQFLATSAILVWGLAPARYASGTPARIRDTLRSDLLSRADYERMERGYYEQILDAGRNPVAPADAADSAAKGGVSS